MGNTWFSNNPGPIPAQARIPSHAAATATEEWPVFRAPFACTVKKVTIVPQAAVTGDNTNTTTLDILNKGASGSGTTQCFTYPLPTGTNLVAFDETAMTLVAAPTMVEGDVLSLRHTKVGTGLLIPECVVYIEYYPL